MSASIDGNGVVTLAGDGFGRNRGRKQLVAAPSSAVKMQFVFRPYFTDGAATSQVFLPAAWDSAAYLGLGFDDVFYDLSGTTGYGGDALPNFFGLGVTGLPVVVSGGTTTSNNFKVYYAYDWSAGVSPTLALGAPWGDFGGVYRHYAGLHDGNGTVLFEKYYANDTTSATTQHFLFPRNASDGAKLTYMWEVYGSLVDNSVYCRIGVNKDSLAEGDDMFTALDGRLDNGLAWNNKTYTIHGNTTSNWRNAGSPGTMNFPRWLKFGTAIPSYSLVLKYWKIRYLDADNVVLREQAP